MISSSTKKLPDPLLNPEANTAKFFFCVACGARLAFPANPANHVVECPSCSRFVQVPDGAGRAAAIGSPPITLPSGVIALEVKFLCGSCNTKLRVDARWEGLAVKCPVCSARLSVPLWSGVPTKDAPPRRAPAEAATTILSMAEVEFLAEPAADPARVAC